MTFTLTCTSGPVSVFRSARDARWRSDDQGRRSVIVSTHAPRVRISKRSPNSLSFNARESQVVATAASPFDTSHP